MHRCAIRYFSLGVLLSAGLFASLLANLMFAGNALAQVQRNFPATALRGELRITQPPEALLNGQPARLAPGARIRDTQNMMVVSGAVVGLPLLVHYTLDTQGLVLDVWVLNEQERARRPWPTTPAQARQWVFDPAAQTWSRP